MALGYSIAKVSSGSMVSLHARGLIGSAAWNLPVDRTFLSHRNQRKTTEWYSKTGVHFSTYLGFALVSDVEVGDASG
jgi:hypothetical protein